MRTLSTLMLIALVAHSINSLSLTHELLGDIALKSDNGKYLSRCNGCGSAAYSDSASVHGTNPSDPWSKWTPEKQSNGKWTLKSDNGKYLARCNNCWYGAAYPDAAFVHESNPANPWAQWEAEKLDNGKWTLKSDNGKYLARCNNCVYSGAYSDFAFVH